LMCLHNVAALHGYTIQAMYNWNVTSARGCYLDMHHSLSSTQGTKTTTDSGSVFGVVRARGVNTTPDFGLGALITFIQDGSAGASYLPTNMVFTTYSATAENANQLVLHCDGLNGMGTDVPSYKLSVVDTSGNCAINIQSAASGSASLWLGRSGYLTLGGVSYANGTDTLSLRSGGSDMITITSAEIKSKNFYPYADNTYYLGKNDDDTPFAWRGIALKDQGGTGKYYRLEVYGDAIRIVDLTD